MADVTTDSCLPPSCSLFLRNQKFPPLCLETRLTLWTVHSYDFSFPSQVMDLCTLMLS